MKQQRVAIIGAGISGLLACKYTLSKGFYPIVFESQSSIGGVWTHTMETTKLQIVRSAYQFSDFAWPPSVTEVFPSQYQVFDYIQSYARRFDLIRHIRFNSRVVSIDYRGPSDEEMQSWSLWGGTGEPFGPRGTWNVTVEDTNNLSTEVHQVEFVILCVGRFSGVPDMPEFPPNKGPEAFGGEVIHSMDYAAMDYESAKKFLKGKRITVVGNQKSGTEIAIECAAVNGVVQPCTMLYRSVQWTLPDMLPWGVSLAILYFTRFSELLLHKPGEGFFLSLLATLLSPVKWGISKFVETHIKRKLPLAKFGMVPKSSFMEDLASCSITVISSGFYNRVEEGSIVLKKSSRFSFSKEGIMIDNEVEPLKTDVVILATGFRGDKKLKDIVASTHFKDIILGSPNNSVPLYRGCIHPRIPQLAIIGFAESISNLHTSEMGCRWLSELLDGTFRLPSIKEMEEDISKWDGYLKHYTGRHYRRSCIGALHIWYNDLLCKDMGLNPRRKKGFLSEFFQPYGSLDYNVS